ncbi:twin-arginine translocase TatA/TatE family subunit [bacterium]|nr:twin-arginine translocase TatA/TatE family subunit [bacterium]
MGIGEIIVLLVIALIVIPPEKLPDVMRGAGKLMRELRLASNLVMHELTSVADLQAPPRETPPQPNRSSGPAPAQPEAGAAKAEDSAPASQA